MKQENPNSPIYLAIKKYIDSPIFDCVVGGLLMLLTLICWIIVAYLAMPSGY